MELDTVLADLEGLDYACWPLVIPACAVDARHRRERVWIVANAAKLSQREQANETDALADCGRTVNEPRNGGEALDDANLEPRQPLTPQQIKTKFPHASDDFIRSNSAHSEQAIPCPIVQEREAIVPDKREKPGLDETV